MAQFKVILTTTNGSSIYMLQEGSVKQVYSQADQIAKAHSDVINYTVEQVSAPQYGSPQMTPNAMHELYKATGGLVGCILILIVAEFKIRQWLRG